MPDLKFSKNKPQQYIIEISNDTYFIIVDVKIITLYKLYIYNLYLYTRLNVQFHNIYDMLHSRVAL